MKSVCLLLCLGRSSTDPRSEPNESTLQRYTLQVQMYLSIILLPVYSYSNFSLSFKFYNQNFLCIAYLSHMKYSAFLHTIAEAGSIRCWLLLISVCLLDRFHRAKLSSHYQVL
jgi:hypothetical protein